MQCSLVKFTLALNSVLFLELFVFEFPIGMSGNFLCSISALVVKIVLLLYALQLLMLLARTLVYSEAKLFLLIFHNCTSYLLIIITLILLIINIYISASYVVVDVNAVTERLSKLYKLPSFVCVCVCFVCLLSRAYFKISL
jgi:hypothetical protein